MRILMLSYEFPPLGGGGSRVVSGLSRELVRQGHEVDLVTMGFRGLPRQEAIDGVRVQRVPALRKQQAVCTAAEAASYVMNALRVTRRLVRQHQYDLVHAHFIFPDGLLAWLLRRSAGLPYVITAHGSDVPGYNPHRLKTAHQVLASLWRRVVHGAERVVCPSRALQTLALAQSADAALTVIPNGIDVDRFRTNQERRKRILVVARMVERKGIQYLLQAVDGRFLDYEVHLVGEGPYRSALEAQAKTTRATVKFWGWMDNRSPALKELFETASIFVLPSEAENFPIALLEAMAAGLAIITTKRTGCAEVVADTGLLVEAKNSAAIRQALETLTAEPARLRALGQAARRRLEENFTWTAVARRYEAFYGECRHSTA
jgi:glycosyltransferase involved in cell wall biosynthesis